MLEEVEVLWAGEGRRWFHGRSEGQSFLVEEREWPDEASALDAYSQDERWKQWLSYCHHPAMLMPGESQQHNQLTRVLYPWREPLICWPVYVEQVFREYMADEELTLELAFRLTLIWGGMLGKGLRRVALEKPRPDMIFLTGEGDVLAAPPRLVEDGEPGFASLLEGMAEILCAALTRQEATSRRQELTRCRDLNREISLDAQKLVRRCLPGQEEAFDTLGGLTRALTQLHIKRHAEEPYRDRGPLVCFRPPAAERDFEPEMKQALAVQAQPCAAKLTPVQAFFRLKFFDSPRSLRLLFVVIYAVMMTPFLFGRGTAGIVVGATAATVIYWMCTVAVVAGYRRRNSR